MLIRVSLLACRLLIEIAERSGVADYSPVEIELFYRKFLAGQMGNLVARISNAKIIARLPSPEALYTPPATIEKEDEELVAAIRALPGSSTPSCFRCLDVDPDSPARRSQNSFNRTCRPTGSTELSTPFLTFLLSLTGISKISNLGTKPSLPPLFIELSSTNPKL